MIRTRLILIFLVAIFTHDLMGETTCSIESGSKIYYIDNLKDVQSNDLINSSTCPEPVLTKFKNLILDFSDEFRSDYIRNVYKKEFLPYTLSIVPEKIKISPLDDLINKRFFEDRKKQFINLKFLGNAKTIILENNEKIDFECSNCESNGNKNIEVTIKSEGLGNPKKLWLYGTVTEKATVLEAASHLNAFANTTGQFTREQRYVEKPEIYFQDLKQLQFYRLNKPMRKGHLLTKNDLTPINVVKSGSPTKVIIKNNTLTLTMMAIPLGSASLGESVTLRNTKTNKKIVGKAIDFDKVIVEL